MPTIVLDEIPPDVYAGLQRRATARHRTLRDELLVLVREAVMGSEPPPARLPDLILTDEISAPFDLPRSSKPVQVRAIDTGPRLPDPFVDENA